MFIGFFIAALAAYLADIAWFASRLCKDRPAPRFQHGMLMIAFALHTAALLTRSLTLRQCPIFFMEDSLSFLAWATILISLLLGLKYRPNPLEGFAPALAAVLLIASLGFHAAGGERGETLIASPQRIWISLHAGLYFMAYTAFAIACLSGAVYLLLERRLKQRQVTGMTGSLGSLNSLDVLNYVSLATGVLCLTAGIVAGAILLGDGPAAWLSGIGSDSKIILSLFSWLLYAVLLFARATHRLRGRKVALLSLAGFAAVLLTFVGVHHMIKGP